MASERNNGFDSPAAAMLPTLPKNGGCRAPGALRIFLDLASRLFNAQGSVLLHRVGSDWKVLLANGALAEALTKASDISHQPDSGKSLVKAKAINSAVLGGHLLDVGIGQRTEPRYRALLLRSDRFKPFTIKEIKAILRTLPHLVRLLSLEERLNTKMERGASRTALTQLGVHLLAQMDVNICVVDEQLRPALDDATLRKSYDEQIVPLKAEDASKLRVAVLEALSATDGKPRGLSLGGRGARRPALISGMQIQWPDGPRRIAAIVMPRGSELDYDSNLIRTVYGLTRVESGIVKLLCEGATPKEAALRTRMSQNTVRHYLKLIFRKLDIHRQSELVGMIAATIGILRGAGQSPAALDRRGDSAVVSIEPEVGRYGTSAFSSALE